MYMYVAQTAALYTQTKTPTIKYLVYDIKLYFVNKGQVEQMDQNGKTARHQTIYRQVHYEPPMKSYQDI